MINISCGSATDAMCIHTHKATVSLCRNCVASIPIPPLLRVPQIKASSKNFSLEEMLWRLPIGSMAPMKGKGWGGGKKFLHNSTLSSGVCKHIVSVADPQLWFINHLTNFTPVCHLQYMSVGYMK